MHRLGIDPISLVKFDTMRSKFVCGPCSCGMTATPTSDSAMEGQATVRSAQLEYGSTNMLASAYGWRYYGLFSMAGAWSSTRDRNKIGPVPSARALARAASNIRNMEQFSAPDTHGSRQASRQQFLDCGALSPTHVYGTGQARQRRLLVW